MPRTVVREGIEPNIPSSLKGDRKRKFAKDAMLAVNCIRYLFRKQGTGFLLACDIIFARMPDPERKQVPDIPGVKRGGEFFKGFSPEMGGQKSAFRRRVEFGKTPLDLCLVNMRQVGSLTKPFLGREEGNTGLAELWEPRVDLSDGSVITWRWGSRKTGGGDYSDYIPIGGRKLDAKFNYGEIPPGWTVAVLVPQKVKGGIEAAMRQQNEIAHDYGKEVGPEKARVDETFDLLYETSSAFAMGDVTSESDLSELAATAENHFKIHGLLESNDSIWQRVVTYTLKATQKDKINRVNPLISRIRVRAAFLAGTEREMIARSASDKAENVYYHLALIRAGIRLKIKMAADTLDDLCGFSPGKLAQDPVMLEGSATSTTEQGREIGQYLETISNDVLAKIQPAPYLLPATIARIILTGETTFKNNEERDRALKILNGSGYIKYLDSSAVRWLKEKKPLVARSRMRLTHDLLNQSLRDPETSDTKVFD